MARSTRSQGSAGVGGEEKAVAPSAKQPATPCETPPASSPAMPSFEAALASLEGVVARLESGDMPLEQALEAFEEGVALSRRCAATLDAAERRIEILVAERVVAERVVAERAGSGARFRVEPFEAGAGDEDPDGED